MCHRRIVSAPFWTFLLLGGIAIASGGPIWSAAAQNACESANWAWMEGASSYSQRAVYGTIRVPAAANTPGARYGSVSWKDVSGNLWLFGGYGCDGTGTLGYLNDLWKYDAAAGNWTWMKGANTVNQTGTHGTLGVSAAANTPGARYGAVSWTDASGMLWLFGGSGFPGTGSFGYLNDLWKHDPATGNWTWVRGVSTTNALGAYGTLGAADPANTPGARHQAVSWMDPSGMLWIFGGYGYAGSGGVGYLNDVWKYDSAADNWTWIKGSNATNQTATYGTLGTPAAANTPGARYGSSSWADSSGRLWLFGGVVPAGTNAGLLNDLWQFDPASGNWTWMKGVSLVGQSGTYGTLGTPAAANTPGGRSTAVAWTDPSGALWLFGGNGYDTAGAWGSLNDLWKYDPVSGNWTWIKGAPTISQRGSYGTIGTPGPANRPGARNTAVSWMDNSGTLWLFGGQGYYSVGGLIFLNDLWKYDPVSGNWTWVKGASANNLYGVYGTAGVPADGNKPGPRRNAVTWTDASGGLWLCSGYGYDSDGGQGHLNDLWKYDPASGNWTWMKGASLANQPGTYGTLGTPATANTPGARASAVSWTDASGRLWLFGGNGYDRLLNSGLLNDLWVYDPATGNWTWMKGASTVGPFGNYGELETPAAANIPGARDEAVAWSDASDRLWLLGGYGFDASGSQGYLNDLWNYDPATGHWTWMKGASGINQPGLHGTRGVPADANNPGARAKALSWTNASGKLWFFGGYGYDGSGGVGRLNDLWSYDPATGFWTWMKGSSVHDQFGTYGILGMPAAANTPGARLDAIPWTDPSGRFWLFGGSGLPDSVQPGFLNDLWNYDPATGYWTWMKGSSPLNRSGIYGTLGITDPANMPGSRDTAVSWVDGAGALWLFGGQGYDGNGTASTPLLGDLWRAQVSNTDTNPPIITLVGANPATVACRASYTDAGATAMDACTGSRTASIVVTGTVNTNTPGTYVVRYNVSDGNGNNAAEVTRTVNVVDGTRPAITLLGVTPVTVACHGSYTDAGATAMDACAGDRTSSIVLTNPLDVNTPGVYTLRYNVTDGNGNNAIEVTRRISVVDAVPPVITLLGDNPATVECRGSYMDAGATAMDDCAGDRTGNIVLTNPLDVNTPGVYTLRYNVSDGNGNNAAEVTRTVHVADTTPPVITLLGDNPATVECRGSYMDAGATADDVCAGSLAVTVGGDAVNPAVPGDYTVTYSALDGSGNSAAGVTRAVAVLDGAAPVITLLGDNPATVECHGSYTDAGATADDACTGSLSVTVGGDTVNADVPGDYTVTYNASGGSGGSAAEVTRTVTVADTTAPIITLLGDSTATVECHGSYTDAGATAADACAGDRTDSIAVAGTPDVDTPGVYTVAYNVSDGNGNSAVEVTRTVRVVDTAKPVITLLGEAEITLDCGQEYTDAGATANGPCSGDLTADMVVSGLPPAAPLGPASWTIAYNVVDHSGSVADTVLRTVTVRDNCTLALAAAGDTLVHSRVGRRAELSVVATGAVGAVSYQWRKESTLPGGKSFDALPGATDATLVIDPVQWESQGLYMCVASDAVTAVDGPVFTFAPPTTETPAAGGFGLAMLAAGLGLVGASTSRRRKE